MQKFWKYTQVFLANTPFFSHVQLLLSWLEQRPMNNLTLTRMSREVGRVYYSWLYLTQIHFRTSVRDCIGMNFKWCTLENKEQDYASSTSYESVESLHGL